MNRASFFVTGIFLSVVFSFLIPQKGSAQKFDATTGSLYTPSINMASQPSVGATMPMDWSLEVVGANAFWSNNILTFSPLKWDWKEDFDKNDIRSRMEEGSKHRRASLQADLHLVNFLFKVPKVNNWFGGVGLNLRSHSSADRLYYDFDRDSMADVPSFLQANAIDQAQRGRATHLDWLEGVLNVSKVIRSDNDRVLAVGGSLKILKGYTAGVAEMKRLEITMPTGTSSNFYPVTELEGRYAFSENLDEQLNDFENYHSETLRAGGKISLGLDLGATLIQNDPIYKAGFTRDNFLGYDWKLEVSLTDWGKIKYRNGSESRIVEGLQSTASTEDLQNTINDIKSLHQINESLETYANMRPWEEDFTVSLPTRFQVNFDKKLMNDFYLNAHTSFDATFLNFGADFKSHNLSYLTLTPRWEKRKWGVYAPLYLNEKGTFLFGTAVKLGPVILGVHDFAWLFKHSKSGGGFISIVINHFGDKELNACPVF